MGNIVKLTQTGDGDPPDLRKGIISIFASIPAEAVAAKQAEAIEGLTGEYGVMKGVIPLLQFGRQQTVTAYDATSATVEVERGPGDTIEVELAPQVGSSHSTKTPPSFIGVAVDSAGVMSLAFHLQTQEAPSCLNTYSVATGASWDSGASEVVYTSADASYVDDAKTDFFGNYALNVPDDTGSDGGQQAGNTVVISAGSDVLIHILISWDITAGCAVHGVAPDAEDEIGTSAGTDTASKVWCAIDGVNKNGYNLPGMWAHTDTGEGNPNEMLSYMAASVSGKYGSVLGAPSVTLTTSATSVPAFPIAIPSETSLIRESTPFVPNLLVREGRIQFFAGADLSAIKLDLGNPDNVNLFREDDGTPAPLARARNELGAVPLVEFATATAMINGVNSGSLGNLTPDGTITAYTP